MLKKIKEIDNETKLLVIKSFVNGLDEYEVCSYYDERAYDYVSETDLEDCDEGMDLFECAIELYVSEMKSDTLTHYYNLFKSGRKYDDEEASHFYEEMGDRFCFLS